MREFRCKECNYSFKAEREPAICLNCGGNEIAEEKNAQELLDEFN